LKLKENKGMNLIIDAGNTIVKLSVFEVDMFICISKITRENIAKEIQKLLKTYPKINKAICSSVSQLDRSELISALKAIPITFLSYKTPIPFTNLYTTPNTLGVDRIALMAAAVIQFPKQNVLVIDAGTCITYDFLNANAEYFGGSIAPGLQLRYKSLNDYTANLPLLLPKYAEKLIGNSTENAIHSGVSNGLIAEISGVIEQFSNNYKFLVVILTGGDANFLSKRLKSSIFVDPNFLLHGLNYILEYNIDK